MNSVKNENVSVKEYEFNKPLIQNIDSLIDNPLRDCHRKYFHSFDHICEYDINFTNITNNESVNFTISFKNMCLYELNKNLTNARDRVSIFNHINNFKTKIYGTLSQINIHYHLELGTPPLHRHFFSKKLLKIMIIFKHIAMIEEIHFILQVSNGIHKIIHNVVKVYLLVFVYK